MIDMRLMYIMYKNYIKYICINMYVSLFKEKSFFFEEYSNISIIDNALCKLYNFGI